MRYAAFLGCALAGALYGQGLSNPDFERTGARWGANVPLNWKTEGCRQGQSCVELTAPAGVPASNGVLSQGIDAAPYRGKLVR